MSYYFKAEIKVVPGKMDTLLNCLKTTVFPILQARGWKLIGCFAHHSGDVHSITDLWEIENFDELPRGRKVLATHPESAKFRPILSECIEKESLTLLERLI